jgi:cation-transporting ATPase E
MTIQGLTQAQVAERQQAGQTNHVELKTSRSYWDIIKTNVFDPVNIVLYVIGGGMFMVGDTRSAIMVVGLILFNATMGIIQEVRAKQKLDQIALLARRKTQVIREGQEQEIDPDDIVLGDMVLVQAGDQIPVDGRITGDSIIEVDESALTGESDLIRKGPGDEALSGSLCITGKAIIEAVGVGEDSFANKLTKNAREFKVEYTPLQQDVNRLLRLLMLIVLFFAIIAVLALIFIDLPFKSWLQVMAVVTGSISAGMLTLITLNYSWGSVRIGQKGALVQRINAVESLSNVTVLCTDKTGTLTTNQIKYHDIFPVGAEADALKSLLGDFAASASALNKTSQAILDALPGNQRPRADEVPFSSARKWSALAFDDAGDGERPPLRGVYVLGAMAMLRDYLDVDEAVWKQLDAWANQGLRVLIFAGNADVTSLHDAEEQPVLPRLNLLGLISFSDELRPHLQETLQNFADNGIQLKVISGDNPTTVAALARQAGLPGDLVAVSGPELAKMSQEEFDATAKNATVFGRITPDQKEALVTALRKAGEYVAMIGDGVNDVLSLKKANLGIAMESGSDASRSVAAMVLLKDSFEAMPLALKEGKRIIGSIQNILKLFMVTVFALLLLIIAITSLGIGFPFTALQNTLLSFFARGAPPFILAIVSVAVTRRANLGKSIIHFTLPASFLLFFFGLLLYLGAFFLIQEGLALIDHIPQESIAEMTKIVNEEAGVVTEESFREMATLFTAQTVLVTFFSLSGILLMLFAEPPLKWFEAGAPFHKRNWFTLLAAAVMIIGYYVVLLLPGLRSFFQLVPLPSIFHLVIIATTIVWVLLQRWVWRAHLLERFMQMDIEETV